MSSDGFQGLDLHLMRAKGVLRKKNPTSDGKGDLLAKAKETCGVHLMHEKGVHSCSAAQDNPSPGGRARNAPWADSARL